MQRLHPFHFTPCGPEVEIAKQLCYEDGRSSSLRCMCSGWPDGDGVHYFHSAVSVGYYLQYLMHVCKYGEFALS